MEVSLQLHVATVFAAGKKSRQTLRVGPKAGLGVFRDLPTSCIKYSKLYRILSFLEPWRGLLLMDLNGPAQGTQTSAPRHRHLSQWRTEPLEYEGCRYQHETAFCKCIKPQCKFTQHCNNSAIISCIYKAQPFKHLRLLTFPVQDGFYRQQT